VFNSIDRSGTNVVIRQHVLHLAAIKSACESLMDEIHTETNELTFGLPGFDIPDDLPIFDELHCREPHFGFLDHARNPFVAQSKDLMKAIITHPQLKGVFHIVDQNNNIVWLPGPCNQYIAKAVRTMTKSFTVTQLNGGAPGRLSEAAARLIRNVPGGSIRNVFVWCCKVLVEMGTFNKTSHATDRDQTMIRATLIRFGRMIIRLLVFIRPLLVEWQLYFRGPSMAYNASHCLYMGHYRPLEGLDLSADFISDMTRLLHFRLTPSDWRQAASFLIADNAVLFQRAQIQTTAADYQIGHSGMMGSEYYALDKDIPPDVDKTIFMCTIRNSASWHILQEFEEDLWAFIEEGNENRLRKMATIDKYRRPDLNRLQLGPPRLHRPLPPVPSQIHAQERMAKLFTNNLAKFTGYMLHYVRPDLRMPYTSSNHQPLILPQPHLLENARKMHNKLDFTFRPGQAAAAQILYDGVHHLGVFTSTGITAHIYPMKTHLTPPDQVPEKRSHLFSSPILMTIPRPPSYFFQCYRCMINTNTVVKSLTCRVGRGVLRSRRPTPQNFYLFRLSSHAHTTFVNSLKGCSMLAFSLAF
jgi:hypothetical protein